MDLAGQKIAVTGASGFIGRYLVRALHTRGAEVQAVVRAPDRLAGLPKDRVHPRVADLTDRDALTAAFDGARAVINNAALVSVVKGQKNAYIHANVLGVENVLHAARDAGVTRVVHMSSAVAYRKKPGHTYEESDPLWSGDEPSHRFSHYAVSKGAGERTAWALAERFGLELSTARPHTVFGAHDRGTFSIWLERFMRSPITVWPVYLRFPSIYAGDLAEAVLRMLERKSAVHRAYNLASPPEAASYWDLMQAYRQTGGGRARLVIPFPVPILRRYPTDRAERDLDFTPRPLLDAFTHMHRLTRGTL